MILVRKALLGCLILGSMLASAGCSQEAANEPDDFAQRIAATQGAAQPPANPSAPGVQLTPEQVAAQSEAAREAGAQDAEQASTSRNKGPYADLIVPPSVQLDAQAAAPCRAIAMSEYLGQPDSPDFRRQVTAANKAGGGTRFLPAGAQVEGDQPTRLNVMFDLTGVARDFRCG